MVLQISKHSTESMFIPAFFPTTGVVTGVATGAASAGGLGDFRTVERIKMYLFILIYMFVKTYHTELSQVP